MDLVFIIMLGSKKNTHNFFSPKNYSHVNIQSKTDNQSTNLQNYNVVQYILFTKHLVADATLFDFICFWFHTVV